MAPSSQNEKYPDFQVTGHLSLKDLIRAREKALSPSDSISSRNVTSKLPESSVRQRCIPSSNIFFKIILLVLHTFVFHIIPRL